VFLLQFANTENSAWVISTAAALARAKKKKPYKRLLVNDIFLGGDKDFEHVTVLQNRNILGLNLHHNYVGLGLHPLNIMLRYFSGFTDGDAFDDALFIILKGNVQHFFIDIGEKLKILRVYGDALQCNPIL
jgi:hypothetical protein